MSRINGDNNETVMAFVDDKSPKLLYEDFDSILNKIVIWIE